MSTSGCPEQWRSSTDSLRLVATEVVVAFIETPARDKLTAADRAKFHIAAEVVNATIEHTAVMAGASQSPDDVLGGVVRQRFISHAVANHGNKFGPLRLIARAGLALEMSRWQTQQTAINSSFADESECRLGYL